MTFVLLVAAERRIRNFMESAASDATSLRVPRMAFDEPRRSDEPRPSPAGLVPFAALPLQQLRRRRHHRLGLECRADADIRTQPVPVLSMRASPPKGSFASLPLPLRARLGCGERSRFDGKRLSRVANLYIRYSEQELSLKRTHA